MLRSGRAILFLFNGGVGVVILYSKNQQEIFLANRGLKEEEKQGRNCKESGYERFGNEPTSLSTVVGRKNDPGGLQVVSFQAL